MEESALRNPLNEKKGKKNLIAIYHYIPELNHHLAMETLM